MYNVKKTLETAEACVFIKTNELKRRNIQIGDQRTSVTLEPQLWKVLHDVAAEHECEIHDLCSMIYQQKSDNSSLASAIRVFLVSYLHIKGQKS